MSGDARTVLNTERRRACQEYADFIGESIENLFPEFGPFATDAEGRYIEIEIARHPYGRRPLEPTLVSR